TANDRAVFINIEGFYRLEGHALEGEKKQGDEPPHKPDGVAAAAAEDKDHHDTDHDSDHEEHHDGDHDEHDEHHHHEHAHEPLPIAEREVTPIRGLCKSVLAPSALMQINKDKDGTAQCVAPAREVSLLMDSIVGPIRIVLL